MSSREQLEHLQTQLLKLSRVGIALSSEKNLTRLLQLILSESRNLTAAEAASLYLCEGDHLRFAVTQNERLEARLRRARNQAGRPAAPNLNAGNQEGTPILGTASIPINRSSLAGYVAVTGKVVNLADAYQIPRARPYRFNPEFDRRNNYRTRSMAVVPMKDSTGTIIGVLQLINARRGGNVVPFEKQSEKLLLSLASQAAVAIKNARLTQELKDAYIDTIFRLSVATEYKDKDTSVHLKRMSRYVGIIAEALGMPSSEVEVLNYAAVLHDIGKLGVADTILTKPGKLEPAEIAEMRAHTTFGAKILGNAKAAVLQLSEIVALTHHEKWDGSGYPRGLKGADIPLPGRIVAVADVFDALTSQRSYKPALSVAEAVGIIRTDSGRHFDPDVVDAFMRSLDRITAIHAEYRT